MQVFVIKYIIKWQYLWEASQQREKLPELQFLWWQLKPSSVSSVKRCILHSMKGFTSKCNKPVKLYSNVVLTARLFPLLFTIKLWVISTIVKHLNIATAPESSSSRCCFLVFNSSSIPIHLSWLLILCNFAMTSYLQISSNTTRNSLSWPTLMCHLFPVGSGWQKDYPYGIGEGSSERQL